MGKLLIIIFVLLLLVTGALAFQSKFDSQVSWFNGTVGIGTQTPSSELQVVGVVTATSFSGIIAGDDIVDGSIDSSELGDDAISISSYASNSQGLNDVNMGAHDVCLLSRVRIDDDNAGTGGNCQIFESGPDWILRSEGAATDETRCNAKCLDW